MKLNGGWNTSSISGILKNKKYIGTWEWKKCKNVKDPMTGRTKKVIRPEKERLSTFREDLIIISKNLWETAQKRWVEIKGTWPVSKKRKAHCQQKSYIHTSPNHLLSGLMKCNSCNGAIVLISGKGGGYYGCYNAKRKTCNNNLLVPRKRIERIIISELKEKILTTVNLEYVYKNVEKLVVSGLNEVPELTKKKKAQYEKLLSEIRNYLNFIKMGNLSKAVSEALTEAENKGENLKQEIESLEFQKQNSFKTPPREWINHRLDELKETLSKDTVSSALALKKFLAPIRLEPVSDKESDFYHIISNGEKEFKPYYVAHTKIQTLALLDNKDKGSNWSNWWRWADSNCRPQALD